ncbi:MAG: protein BatD [Bacteroidia bacterium]|nr:protein BatD [Bacteroidia bacterium]
MKRFQGLLLVWLLFICAGTSRAQTFTAGVSKNPVGLNEQFQLSFTLSSSGSAFKAPSLSDFMVLSGPNQSTSMQFVNGSMSQSLTFSYILQPKKEGSFKIESAAVESGGKLLLSNPLTITVNKGSGGGQAGQQGNDQKTNISTNNIFLKVSIDKSNVYLGEAIVATYKLYTNVQVVNYSINKVPAFNGFWSQDMQMPAQLQLKTEVVNGVTYQVGEIKKVVLFPQQSGTLTLEPMEGECIARIQVKRNRSGSPFDIFNDPFFNDPFFGGGGIRDVKFAVKSTPVKITVKSLPANPPASFNGAVGRYSIEGLIDKSNPKANDAVSFKLKLSGKGNIKLAEAPEFELSPDIEKYDPKITDNIAVNEKGASGVRTFEYLLIPRHQGNYSFGPVEFTYFDLDKKGYVTLKTPAYQLKVERGAEGGGTAVASTGKADFQILGRDIRFIKTSPTLFTDTSDDFYGSLIFWILILAGVAGFAFLVVFRRKQLALNADMAAVKSRKATRMARKRLETAGSLLKSGNQTGFYDETGKALWGYLSDKLKLPVSTLTKESVVAALTTASVTQTTTNRLVETLDYCEFARFARMEGGKNPEQVYQETVNLITQLEDEIKN